MCCPWNYTLSSDTLTFQGSMWFPLQKLRFVHNVQVFFYLSLDSIYFRSRHVINQIFIVYSCPNFSSPEIRVFQIIMWHYFTVSLIILVLVSLLSRFSSFLLLKCSWCYLFFVMFIYCTWTRIILFCKTENSLKFDRQLFSASLFILCCYGFKCQVKMPTKFYYNLKKICTYIFTVVMKVDIIRVGFAGLCIESRPRFSSIKQ